jgi:hypothetical protein
MLNMRCGTMQLISLQFLLRGQPSGVKSSTYVLCCTAGALVTAALMNVLVLPVRSNTECSIMYDVCALLA